MRRCTITSGVMTATLGLVVLASLARADVPVNLEWRPDHQAVVVGDTVRISLYAVSADPELDQSISAMNVIIQWDPSRLELLGIDDTGGPSWLFSGFPADPYSLNESVPPADGDGLYMALAPLGETVYATPVGLLVTTFEFRATDTATATTVSIIPSAGEPPGETEVFSGDSPNTVITGSLDSVTVLISCTTCPTDLDGDGATGMGDLALLLTNYGIASGANPGDGDVDCDGAVNMNDLLAMLANYGDDCR